jgi:hypothetical protein
VTRAAGPSARLGNRAHPGPRMSAKDPRPAQQRDLFNAVRVEAYSASVRLRVRGARSKKTSARDGRVGCAFLSAMAYGRASAVRSRLITVRGTASTRAESQSRLGPISCDHDAKLWPPDGKISARTCVGKRTSERNRWVSR